MLGSFAFAIIASSFLSAWLIHRENEIYNFIQSACPQMIIKNLRLLRSTGLGMRRAVSETSKYYHVVDRLPSISHRPDQMSAREQLVLTSKNAVVLFFLSLVCYLAIFFMQFPEWKFLESFFIFIFAGFFASSALFIVNIKSAASSLLSMMIRSSSGAKYAPVGHLLSFVFFSFLSMIFFWAYSLAPASLSVILVLPSIIFGLRSLFFAVKLLLLGRLRL